jgi:hypothetical protein
VSQQETQPADWQFSIAVKNSIALIHFAKD